MSNQAQLKILNLCKGMPIAQAMYRLEIVKKYQEVKKNAKVLYRSYFSYEK